MKRGRKPLPVPGAHGPKGEKMMRERLQRALKKRDEDGEPDHNGRKPQHLDQIVQRLVELAVAGEAWAVREVFDRIDGKPVAEVQSNQKTEGTIEYVFKWSGDAPKPELIDVTPEGADHE